MYEGELGEKLNERELKKDGEYVVGASVPLMPKMDAADLKEGDLMYTLPGRCPIKVLEVKDKRTTVWYKVEVPVKESQQARSDNKRSKLKGWINGIALIRAGVFEVDGSEVSEDAEEAA